MSRIKQYLMSFCRYTLRKEKEDFLVNTVNLANFNTVNNITPINGKKIGIVVPEIGATVGGGSSILRIGTYLRKNGFEVMYVVYNTNNLKRAKKNAAANIGNNQNEFVAFDNARDINFDIVIATSWASVYYSKLLAGYKMYFIQDYEPYFYEVGDEFFLSRRTYELGFHMISLGEWNKKKIVEQCGLENVKIDHIEFPYEPSEYKMVRRDYKSYANKKTINIVVYIKKTGRRIPIITQEVLLKTKEMLQKDGIELKISFYGINKHERIIVGENLGRLTKKELFDLYSRADFGMVASMTNISLVPFEMLATGLPVIEYYEGTYKFFLGDDSAVLIDMQAEDLYSKLMSILKSPDELITMMNKAQERINKLSWDKSCQQFEDIINNLYK